MECPACMENVTEQLSCGHCVHRACVQAAADAMQEHLVELGYAPIKYGRCPVCRADQEDIFAKAVPWWGAVEFDSDLIAEVMAIVENSGFVKYEQIPPGVLEQLPNASVNEKMHVVNTAATILWVNKNQVPSRLRMTKVAETRYRSHLTLEEYTGDQVKDK